MDAVRTMGDQIRTARMKAAHSNERLATYAGAAEELDVGTPDTIGRWERDESTPTNFNVKRMALKYNAPELMANYCALSCPIGQGRMKEVHLSPVEQLALKLYNRHRGLTEDMHELMGMAEDGVIDGNERVRFDAILERLGEMAETIRIMTIFAEKYK